MPNSIATEKNIAYVVDLIEAKTPALDFIANRIDDKFTNKSSATVDVEMVDYGVITEGEAVGDKTVTTQTVPVSVGVINSAADLGIVEEALQVGNFEKVVAEPRAAKFASYINAKVLDAAFYNAQTAVVSTGTFAQLSLASAELAQSRIDGKKAGFINPKLKALITNSGVSQWAANPSLGSQLYDGDIKEYDGVLWQATNDIPSITTGVVPTGTTALTANVTAEGATVLALNNLSSATGTVKKGTLLFVAGCNAVDVLGADVGSQRAFIVAADATVTASAASVTVKPIYFAGPRKNVSVASLASGALVSSPMTAASTYLRGVCWIENSMCYANKPLSPMSGVDSSTLNAGKIRLRASAQSNVDSGKSTYRWDTMFGVEAVQGMGICDIFVKV